MKAQMWNISGWIAETNPETLKKEYSKKLKKAGFEIIGFAEHYFEPQGYTALYLLAESHFALHTFPEEGETYYELSSCVKKQFNKFVGTA